MGRCAECRRLRPPSAARQYWASHFSLPMRENLSRGQAVRPFRHRSCRAAPQIGLAACSVASIRKERQVAVFQQLVLRLQCSFKTFTPVPLFEGMQGNVLPATAGRLAAALQRVIAPRSGGGIRVAIGGHLGLDARYSSSRIASHTAPSTRSCRSSYDGGSSAQAASIGPGGHERVLAPSWSGIDRDLRDQDPGAICGLRGLLGLRIPSGRPARQGHPAHASARATGVANPRSRATADRSGRKRCLSGSCECDQGTSEAMNCRTSVKASRLVKLHDGLPRKAIMKTKALHKYERLC
jgi:hypothetical protein